MKRRITYLLLCAGLLVIAGITAFTVPASAQLRNVTVQLPDGRVVTVTVDVPPGTPLSDIDLPGVPVPPGTPSQPLPTPEPQPPLPPPRPRSPRPTIPSPAPRAAPNSPAAARRPRPTSASAGVGATRARRATLRLRSRVRVASAGGRGTPRCAMRTVPRPRQPGNDRCVAGSVVGYGCAEFCDS